MLSLNKLSNVSIAAAVFLSACTTYPFKMSPPQIFYKDGRVAYVASCKSSNAIWGDCLKAAGLICKDAGYTILEKSNPTYTYDENEKELIFACNGKPNAAENK